MGKTTIQIPPFEVDDADLPIFTDYWHEVSPIVDELRKILAETTQERSKRYLNEATVFFSAIKGTKEAHDRVLRIEDGTIVLDFFQAYKLYSQNFEAGCEAFDSPDLGTERAMPEHAARRCLENKGMKRWCDGPFTIDGRFHKALFKIASRPAYQDDDSSTPES